MSTRKKMRAGKRNLCAALLVAGAFLAGCSNMRKLVKSDPEVDLQLPARSTPAGAETSRKDTVRSQKIITYRKQDGTELFFTPVDIDSLTGEKMMSVAIDEVVISASNRRNLVERNGKINVEFVVTVPASFQNRDWQLALDPKIAKGSDTLWLDPLIYSGDKFRSMQQQEYDRYARYRSRIVDSADYFDRFGNKRAYNRYMRRIDERRTKFGADYARLESLSPEEAMFDGQVGWTTPRERNRQYALLKHYVRATDRKVARNISYTPDTNDKFDHLTDYFTPRFRYEGVDVLPGGEIYTRVEGEYPDAEDREREEYIRRLAAARQEVRAEVDGADNDRVGRLAMRRVAYTGFERPAVEGILRDMTDSAILANYLARRNFTVGQLAAANGVDTNAIRQGVLHWGKIARNEDLASGSGAAFARIVRNPYHSNARLDTVIRRVDGSIQYFYSEQVQADENTSKLRLFLAGDVQNRSGRTYRLQKSDTLVYNVASMTTFLDPTPRYMQRIVLRDAEANARFFFTFPAGKSTLVDTLRENRLQIDAVRDLTRSLMTDPVYIIDSITLRATSSPEGTWQINDRLARERAEALRRVLVSEFRVLYDSLKVAANYTIDEAGNVVLEEAREELPNLPELLRTKWLAEDWDELRRLVLADSVLTDKEGVLAIFAEVANPDMREWRIRSKYPKAYERMRRLLYPRMRAVDFRFNLHRRGMQQDTVYTTEIDSSYMHAVELLRKRRYEQALEILRPYEDRNTALAYMSLGYDAAAFRILQSEPGADTTPDIQYMLAILSSRMGNEEQAVHYFLRSVELRENLKFRGNLDPEISRLIRKYGLFKEDFQ